jgi:ubiquinone/menaquinone biosynthesis C-methylase UbiE
VSKIEQVRCGEVRGDPEPPAWATLALPPAWPDVVRVGRPRDLVRLLRPVFGWRSPVELPASLPGRERIPRYLQQEMHGLPNGFYSQRITQGYVRWFDATMLHTLRHGRARVAATLRGATSALDLGCGDGKVADALVRAGVPDVWAIDPSPYLLQIGARTYPRVRFTHGVAEDLPFPDGRFDAIGACFLFHELPPRHADQALHECARVLRPGGRLALCEPSPEQLALRAWGSTVRQHGWRGIYFRVLARAVFEPFVAQWHARRYQEWLASAGLTLVTDERAFPLRFLVGAKPEA